MSLEEASVKNRRLKNEISKAASQVRKKYKAIKLGQLDEVQTFNKMFKPVTEKITNLSETMRTTLQTKTPIKPTEVKIIPVQATSSTPPKNFMKGDVRPPQRSPKKSVAVPHFIPEETITEHIPEEDETEPILSINMNKNVSNSNSTADIHQTYEQIYQENPDALEEYLNQYPEITRHYLEEFFTNTANCDTTYGIRHEPKVNAWYMRNHRIDFDSKGNIFVNNQPFTGSSGLYELLFMIKPDENLISEQDRLNYRKIVDLTNVHRRKYDPTEQIRGCKSYKYKTFIYKSPQRRRTKSTTGFGMRDNDVLVVNRKPIEYVFWDNANELVDRLRLLIASTVAGNNNHNNEIVSIVEELREAGIIA